MLKLDELANRAGVSPRTIRYYIQRGLLAAPEFKGPDTAYDDRHLLALRAIKRLQDDHWPLDAIASALDGKSSAELKKIAERGLGSGAVASSPPPARAGRRGERITLADGIELWVDDSADRALVEQIIHLGRKRGHP